MSGESFSREVVEHALFEIHDTKTPRPDGYTRKIFKDAWLNIGEDITEVVLDFLSTGKLLRPLNVTTL